MMKLDDFDLLALSFFVPRMAEGAQSVHTYLKEHGWATRKPKFIRAWLALRKKKESSPWSRAGPAAG